MQKTVLLDLDDTILDFGAAEKMALSHVLRQFAVEPTEAVVRRYSEINAGFWQAMERGEIGREELKTARFALLFSELGVSRPVMEVKTAYEEKLGDGFFLVPGAIELLEDLHGKYPLYLASNGTVSVQKRRIAGSGIGKYFKDVFLSEAIGYAKPDVRYFEGCFQTIEGFCRDAAVIVGDSLTSDILGAKNAGIRSIWFHKPGADPKNAPVDGECSSLAEIPALLAEIFKK